MPTSYENERPVFRHKDILSSGPTYYFDEPTSRSRSFAATTSFKMEKTPLQNIILGINEQVRDVTHKLNKINSDTQSLSNHSARKPEIKKSDSVSPRTFLNQQINVCSASSLARDTHNANFQAQNSLIT
jgi:hypothetical protein